MKTRWKPPVLLLPAIAIALGVAEWTTNELSARASRSLRLPGVIVSGLSGPSWVIASPTGATAVVFPSPESLRVGRARFEIALDRPLPSKAPVTVDLASPTMPMHGVTRFMTTRTRAGVYLANLEIPMEGRWALYINLGNDAAASVIEFDVLPASNAAPRAHHPPHGA